MDTPPNTSPIETPAKTEEKSIGPAIGIIVIIVIIILGGLYFWGQRIERQKQLQKNIDESSSMNSIESETSIKVSGSVTT